MTQSIPTLNTQILEEASAWFIDFNEEEVSLVGHEEFIAWLRRSPEHVRAFLLITTFWEDAGRLGKRPNDRVDALIARAKVEHNVYPLEFNARDRASDATATSTQNTLRQSPEPFREHTRSKRLWLATAASILIVLGFGTIAWYNGYRGTSYATEIGEQRSITLEDGSSIELNSRSRIKVRFTKRQRSVDLLEGQALFTVAKNAARPFIVATGDSHVRAVGTQFDVYRKHSGTLVTVLEGRVAVAPSRMSAPRHESPLGAEARSRTEEFASTRARSNVKSETSSLALKEDGPGIRPGEILLAAGEQMMITPAAIELPKPANIVITTAWTDQKLIFESTPLREVVEEFNRYNREQLVIRDPDLNDFHVSGVFSSTNSSRMVEFLRQRFGVTMNRSRDVIEIFRRDRSDTFPSNVAPSEAEVGERSSDAPG